MKSLMFNLVFVLMVCLVLHAGADWSEGDDEPENMVMVDAVLGRSAEMPCNMEPGIKEDRVYMVLWFREGSSKPLYRFDVRGRPFNKALLWSDTNAFGPRAYFVTGKRPSAALQLEAVELKDAGIYRCRVDFRNSPTRNFQVNLSVIVPPHQLMIYDNSGRELHDVVGPLSEGADLVLKCEVRGGQPSPTVSWFVNDNIVDGLISLADQNVIVNRLEVPRVRRHQLNSTYKCQASNTKLMQPAEKTIRLELNQAGPPSSTQKSCGLRKEAQPLKYSHQRLKPLSVRLVNKPSVLLAEKEYALTCEAVGSRPQAELSWLRETYKFRRGKIEDWSNETVVTSTVTFAPVPEDDGHHLKCHGVNPKIPGSSLEDTIMLNVVYAPLVSLQLGTSLKPQHIKHGDDVYFECNIRANPREHKISWFHNGNPVVQNVSSGVIISTHSLVLQGVTRQHSGHYTCLAANERGETCSQPVPLRVQFAPVCKSDEPGLVGASIEEMLRVRCEVNADPSDVSFFWQFNNSGESFEVSPTKYVSNNGTISELMYTPTSERDYGTLACWGKNSIGRQLEPCIFQVVPAARPSALRNCTLRSTVNTTGDWLEVECVAGFDGGLPQIFQLEAIDPISQRVRMNLTNAHEPLFKVSLGALSPAAYGGTLQLVLYAANQKGHSESVVLEDIAIRDAEKRTEWVGNGGNSLMIGPLNLLLIGVILSLLTVSLLAAVVAVKKRRDPSPCQLDRDSAVKQLELTHAHGNQQRYVVAYQLKPETKQPDILSRDEPPEREAPSLVYSGPGITATFMSPCTSPTGSLVSGSGGGAGGRSGAGAGSCGGGPMGNCVGLGLGLTPSDSGAIAVSSSNMNLMSASANGTLRAKEHILTNTIPGPESCV